MPTLSRPRKGSLQYWPRKRAAKTLPSANWKPINSTEQGILGYITYKVGMASATVKDNTEHSITKGKRITLPVTILEAPNMKIFSVRFYNKGLPVKDLIVSTDKELKKKLKIPKAQKNLDKDAPKAEEYDDIRIIAYSLVKSTSVKKKPDMIELALSGTKEEKLAFVKEHISKEISLADFVKDSFSLFDSRSLTKGKGNQGPVKRFGIKLKASKSEKGRRRPGSLAPWHPARVTFRAPMAGQLGFFSRVTHNLNLITHGKIEEKDINPSSGFKHYGKIKTSYIIIKGSVSGSSKRQVLLTVPFRKTKKQDKKNFELVEVVVK